MGGGSRSGFLQAGEYSARLNHNLAVRNTICEWALSPKAGGNLVENRCQRRGRLALIASARPLDDSLPFRLSIAASRVVFTEP